MPCTAQAKNVSDSIEAALPPVYYSELSVLEPSFRPNIAEFYYYTRQFSDLMPILSKTIKIVVKYARRSCFSSPWATPLSLVRSASSIPFWTITIGMLFVAVAAIIVAFLPRVRLMLYPYGYTGKRFYLR